MNAADVAFLVILTALLIAQAVLLVSSLRSEHTNRDLLDRAQRRLEDALALNDETRRWTDSLRGDSSAPPERTEADR